MTTELADEIRQLVIAAEDNLTTATDKSGQKAAIQPHYALYLKELARSTRPKIPRAEDYLRVVRAIRDPGATADLADGPAVDQASIEEVIVSPLRVLSALLSRLPDTVVFVIESGASVLTLFTLRGGDEPLHARVELERSKRAVPAAMVDLIRQQREDIEYIGDKVPFDPLGPIRRAGEAAWTAMPAPIRTALASARTILFLPSAFGSSSEFPLELCHAEDGWLGTTRTITRLSSMRTLLELLSPNRAPSRLDPRAQIVQAEESEDLGAVEDEIHAVETRLAALGMEIETDRSPTVDRVRRSLDGGLSVLHYCGHGLAGQYGEELPLARGETLAPYDFSQLSGANTPLVYLSACEVGRARMTAGGGAAGFSTALIEKGAPAVIGCLQLVPDVVALRMADAFYNAAASSATGESLTRARRLLAKELPPSCWGAFALFGDPNLRLGNSSGVLPQTRALTARWDTHVGRYLALRSEESRAKALTLLDAARSEHPSAAEDLDRVADWLRDSFRAAEPKLFDARRDLCARIATHDVVAACELRMLLAMEKLSGSYFGPLVADLVIAPEEVFVGMGAAASIHDTLAWSAFAIASARSGLDGMCASRQLYELREAIGILKCWRLEEPGAAELLAETQRQLDAALSAGAPS